LSSTAQLEPSPNEYLTTIEAAKLLRVSKATLERLRASALGEGPRFLKCGPGPKAKVLYRRTDLLIWLEQHSFFSTSQYDARKR
jgi:hypothetical protein